MKDKSKAVEVSGANWFSDYSSSDLPCRKHPSSSSVGICAYCLKDRLVKLVCPDCGEQRLSSCSCSDISSYRNSCSVEVGSVGRISFLIENEKADFPRSTSKPCCDEKSEDVVLLKRSNSSSIDVKKSGLWKFRRFFRKKREKGVGFAGNNIGGSDKNGETWVCDNSGVSRSGSVSGFRGGFEEPVEGCGYGASSNSSGNAVLKSEIRSDFSEVKPIIGGFNGAKVSGLSESSQGGFGDVKWNDFSVALEGGFKGAKKSNSKEFESGFKNTSKSSFRVSEAEFNDLEESGFIDLKLGSTSESKSEFSGLKMGDFWESKSGFRGSRSSDYSKHGCDSFGLVRENEIWSNGSSCRITVNENDIKRSSRSLKAWKWIFRH